MTRDTFDLFTPKDRGRFGDNEQADTRVNAGFKSDLVDLDLSYCAEKPLAIAVKKPDDGGNKWTWLAKSQIEYSITGTGKVRVTLPEWLAKEKGLL